MTVEELVIKEAEIGGFPRNLRVLRVLRGYDLRELGRRAGVGYDSISFLENGKRKPRPETVEKLARALEVTPETLIGPTFNPAPK